MTKHCFYDKKRERIEFPGTSHSSSVCKLAESVEVTVTSKRSSQVSFCTCLAFPVITARECMEFNYAIHV